MKKLFFIPVLVLLLVGLSASAQQPKLGHINTQELIVLMPGLEQAQQDLETYAKTIQGQFNAMQTELQTKAKDYDDNEATFSELIKTAKLRELANLQEHIQEFGQQAQSDLAKKESELLSPIIEAARAAIREVAEENGYTYVFDRSVGSLLHYPEGDDLLEKVKAKLGIN